MALPHERRPVDEEVTGSSTNCSTVTDAGLTQVMDALRHARQMMVVEIPDSFPWSEAYPSSTWSGIARIHRRGCQADGEGFDSAGNLLVPME